MALKTRSLYLSWGALSFAVFEKRGVAQELSHNTDEIDLLIANKVPQGICELIRALVPEVRSTHVAVEKLPKTAIT